MRNARRWHGAHLERIWVAGAASPPTRRQRSVKGGGGRGRVGISGGGNQGWADARMTLSAYGYPELTGAYGARAGRRARELGVQQLRVLGGFALQTPSGTVGHSLPQRRAEAALAVLAVCSDLGCTRERLTALLWPESDQAHSRHSLRDVLTDVRRALGSDAVRSEGDLLRLDPAVVLSDVHVFTRALAAGCAEDAVRAYGGPLLDGFHVGGAPEFERWLDAERARLSREFVDALVGLAVRAEASGEWRGAAGWWARAVEQDPLNSHLVLQQVRALAAHGDRANAVKLADAHARRLREELDLEPDREVLAKVERIRRGEMVTPPDRPAMTETGDQAGHRSARIRQRLRGELEGAEHLAERVAELTVPGAPPAGPSLRWPRRLAWTALAALAVVAGVVAVTRWPPWRPSARFPRTAIAVLPFQSLSTDSAHAYFASGLHDELITQLARVSALRVIGRTSVAAYQGTSESLRQIGGELGVGGIVEGTVQIVGDRLRVTVQLVDPVTQTHVWAESYDRVLADAFAVESDIAQRVVDAVGATVSGAEASAITTAGTRSAEAYRFYLQGLEYWRRPGELKGNLEAAQQLFERALALDSTFAAAHAGLSLAHGLIYFDYYDRSRARMELQRREAENALRLAPDLPEAHQAVGLVHYSHHEYLRALDEFRVASRGAPSDVDAWLWLGYVHRRLGNYDSTLAAAEHGISLDPHNVWLIYGLKGYTLGWIRRYRHAMAAYRLALALAPDYQEAHAEIGWAYAKWRGQWDTLRTVLGNAPREVLQSERLNFLLLDHQPDSILAGLRARSGPESGPPVGPSSAMFAAWAHLVRGDWAAARAAFTAARVELDSLEHALPDDQWVHGDRGVALAHIGRRTEALEEASWLRRSDEYRFDRFVGGTGARAARAMILAATGESDSALAEIETLLRSPGEYTAYVLARDPRLDPIRHDPRFQALLAKYADPEARSARN